MPEMNQGDGGDRLNDLDLLRDALGTSGSQEKNDQTQVRIAELESQMNQMREEMRAQGDEVQNVLHQKINEVLEALQVSQFESPQPSPAPIQRSPQPNIPPPIPSPADSEPRRSPEQSPIFIPAIPVPTSQRQQETDTPTPIPPAPAPSSVQPLPTETNPSLESLGGLDGFTEQLNAILTQNNSPKPPSTSQPVITPNSQSPVTGAGRSPHPDLVNPPATNSSVINSPAINQSSVPTTSPPATPQPEATSPQLTAIAEDQATRINYLKQVLRDEDVVQLRQINEKLDFKLRQVEDYIASSQQPINDLLPLMTELVQLKIREARTFEPVSISPPRKGKSWGAIFSFLLLLILIPLGLYGYWLRREYLLEQDMAIALTATPELALYRLNADVQGNKLYLTGKLPNETLKNRATAIAVSTLPSLELSNNIAIVDPLLDPSLLDDEINKILKPLNAVNGIQVTHQLDGDRLSLDGTVIQAEDIDTIITALEKINGINQITNNIQVQSQPITARLYFDQNSAAIKPDDVNQKLNRVKEFLQQHPNLNLRIIGYQHPSESANDVALKRAQSAQILLEDQGIDRRRIIALGLNQSPPDTTADDPIWLSRTIIFETSAPTTDSATNDVETSTSP